MNIFEAMIETKQATPANYHLYVKEGKDGYLRWYDKKTDQEGGLVSWYGICAYSWRPY